MGKSREPQIILKTDRRNVILELGLGENSKQKWCPARHIFHGLARVGWWL
jgi:hypothetical protein